MISIAKTTSGLLSCLLATSCGSTMLMRVDALNRQLNVQTILIGRSFSLYSPFGVERTAQWNEMVEQEWRRVSCMFGDPPVQPTPIQILGMPLKRIDHGDTVTIAMPDVDGHHGYTHYASDQNAITVVVAVPTELKLGGDRALTLNLDHQQRDRMILRHELCHLFFRFRALPLDADWFNEGLAYESMWMSAASDDELKLAPYSPALLEAAKLAPAPGCLAPILSAADLDDDQLRLSQSLVRYLMERSGGDPRAAISYIGAHTDEQLVALEAQWLTWLRRIDR